jgi:hypothetical protein
MDPVIRNPQRLFLELLFDGSGKIVFRQNDPAELHLFEAPNFAMVIAGNLFLRRLLKPAWQKPERHRFQNGHDAKTFLVPLQSGTKAAGLAHYTIFPR